MKIAVGCDHAGFPLKAPAIAELKSLGHEVLDKGTDSTEAVDYPEYAQAVAEAVMRGDADRGLLLCGSGVGACVAANKVPGVRAATCHDTYSAHQGVEHDDANVLCLGARVVGEKLALEIIRAWAGARFSGAERHKRRLGKVNAIEAKYQRKPSD
ncbi:MAG: ribose 5-phosphate isomerase B [Chloroflexi bacterium]|nr:ribose 5-phosphate isomerase B [Chloroflexota bacterium]